MLTLQQIYFGISTPFSSLSLFTPSITAGLGYDNLRAQLMTVPPYAVAYVVTIAVSWSADHFNAYVDVDRDMTNEHLSFINHLCKIVADYIRQYSHSSLRWASSPRLSYQQMHI